MLVNREAVKEAEVERRLHHERRPGVGLGPGSPLGAAEGVPLPVGRGELLQTSEEVFLAQLHGRALLLNEGFQNQILQVVGRHEAATRVETNVFRSQSDSTGSTVRFSADLLLGAPQHRTQPSKTSNVGFWAVQGTDSNSLSCRASSERSGGTTDASVVHVDCVFADGVSTVEVHQAPVKT